MVNENQSPDTTAIVEVSPQTDALVEQEMPDASDDMRRETKALVDAIRKRAQAEAQAAGDLTRETYLTAVRQAREAIEQNKLIDPDQIEKSFEMLQQDAEKNWNAIAAEIESFGTRLSDAAKAAWDTLMGTKS